MLTGNELTGDSFDLSVESTVTLQDDHVMLNMRHPGIKCHAIWNEGQTL